MCKAEPSSFAGAEGPATAISGNEPEAPDRCVSQGFIRSYMNRYYYFIALSIGKVEIYLK